MKGELAAEATRNFLVGEVGALVGRVALGEYEGLEPHAAGCGPGPLHGSRRARPPAAGDIVGNCHGIRSVFRVGIRCQTP